MQLQVKKAQKSRNNVFRPKQTTNKMSCKIFRGFEVGKKVCVVFPKPKNKTKGSWNIFSSLKQTIRCAWFIYTRNCNKISIVDVFTC